MRDVICLFLFVIVDCPMLAQQASISGQVVNMEEGSLLPGAYVQLSDEKIDESFAAITDEKGSFQFESLKSGRYQLSISFLGYQDYFQTIDFSGEPLILPTIQLNQVSIDLAEIEVKEKVLSAQQLGDTTQFNANAFKTLPDASAEELLEKMPTIVLDNGKVQAQGEDVKEVLVDGRPFFGNDPTASLRNLPAEVIDKIQIFDQQSDQAQFSGFDDGESSKTINIITKVDKRNGQFGKVFLGAGYENKYSIGGNVNLFNTDQRISIIGLSNNVNQQNFATEDLLGVIGSSGERKRGKGPGNGRGRRGGGKDSGISVNDFLVNQSGGISTTHATGINYSDKWGSKIELSGSYFFNYTDNDAKDEVKRQYLDNDEITEIYQETSDTESQNTNHRLNLKLEYQINESSSLIYRPRLSWQLNEGHSNTIAQSIADELVLSQSDNRFHSDLGIVNVSNNLLFRHRLKKRGRTLSLNFSHSLSPKNGESSLQSINSIYNPGVEVDTLDQLGLLDVNSWNGAVNISYTEPLKGRNSLMINYQLSKQEEDSEKETYDFDHLSAAYEKLNNNLSNIFFNEYLTHRIGLGYSIRKRNLTFITRLNVQHAELMNEQSFPISVMANQQYKAVLPFGMLRFNFSRSENLRLIYKSNASLPNIEQLQNVLDNSNPILLSIGNPELQQAISHSFIVRYSKTTTEKSTILYAFLRAGFTENYIANSTFSEETSDPIFQNIDLSLGTQLSRPINLDGYLNIRAFLTYGFPIEVIKSNLNFNLTLNYSRLPGLADEQLNLSNNMVGGIGYVLSSNISDHLDFTLSSRTNLNKVKNSIFSASNSDYLNQLTAFKICWISQSGWSIRSDFNHQYYNGLAEEFSDSYLLWNTSIGKKCFKGQRGEVSLGIYDILKQNNSLSRNITEVYFEDIQSTVLQQYIMLKFTYNIRHFEIK